MRPDDVTHCPDCCQPLWLDDVGWHECDPEALLAHQMLSVPMEPDREPL